MPINEPEERLELDSRLTELSRVRLWVDSLAGRLGLSEGTRFAIHLCMEEAVANVVLHGYRSEPGHSIVIRSSVAGGALSFVIQDQAPPFAPVEPPAMQPASLESATTLESIQPGGNGIRLLYRFAGSLGYEQLADGNRLTLGFPVEPNPVDSSADSQLAG